MLGIPAGMTQNNAYIEDLVDYVDEEVIAWIGLSAVTLTTYNETYDVNGYGVNELMLKRWPVTSVVALTNAGSLVATTDWYLREAGAGIIALKNGGDFFAVGRQQVDITYVAGYSAVPQDLQHAATLWATKEYNMGAKIGFNSEKIGSYSYETEGAGSRQELQENLTIRRIMAKYRRIFE